MHPFRSNRFVLVREAVDIVLPHMGEVLTLELEQKAVGVRELLAARGPASTARSSIRTAWAPRPWCSRTSSGRTSPQIDMFSIDTGPPARGDLRAAREAQRRYKPAHQARLPGLRRRSSALVAAGRQRLLPQPGGTPRLLPHPQGRALQARHRRLRRMGYRRAPRAVRDTRARRRRWNGMRTNGLHKVSPLLDWTEEQVWQYIRARKLPYNALHDRAVSRASAAQPCTRAIQPGEEPPCRPLVVGATRIARVRPASASSPRRRPGLSRQSTAWTICRSSYSCTGKPAVVVGGGRVAPAKSNCFAKAGARSHGYCARN